MVCEIEGRWTWERRHWMNTLHSPKFRDYWSLTINFFRVISRTLIEVFFFTFQVNRWRSLSPFQRYRVYSTGPTHWAEMAKCHRLDTCWESLIPLLRRCRCIPHPHLTWLDPLKWCNNIAIKIKLKISENMTNKKTFEYYLISNKPTITAVVHL